MQRNAPVGLLVGTVACIVLVNLLVAQAIIQARYPDSAARFGPAALAALAVLTVVCALYTARGWRTYLRRPPRN